MKHGADLSFGTFSSFHECSGYKLRSFFVLRFERSLHEPFSRIVAVMAGELGFHAWLCCYGDNQTYIIFDAQEYGPEYLFSEAAGQIQGSLRQRVFRLDYFTNSPWCSVDVEAETIADMVAMRGFLELEIHQKMARPLRGSQALFWAHVFRMARKYLGGKNEEGPFLPMLRTHGFS